MIKKNINKGWEFKTEVDHNIPIFNKNKEKKIVNLPHDFMIESDVDPDAAGLGQSGYYTGSIGTYTKILDIPKDYKNKKVQVLFDGVYMNSIVKLNGHVVKRHHYGYTPFLADLTPYIKFGQKNSLCVIVNNSAQPNARWYSGAGIYRDVELIYSEKVHISPWGIFAYTSHIVGDKAYVAVETTIENNTDEDKMIDLNIKIEREEKNDEIYLGKTKVFVPNDTKRVGKVLVEIQNAKLWDIDSPNLYKVKANISDDETEYDNDLVMFGIRQISADTKNGFMLNGKSINLKGGCVHHGHGIIGASSFKDSEYRKMKFHKDNGYNAIRCAHNPPSKDLLDACDRLGLLVIDEAFDVWNMHKNINDYSQYFESDWEKDIELFMLRDRNHPSIIMWSTGNEITERGGLSNGYDWANKLADKVRNLDPTRLVINSICSFFNGLEDKQQEKYFNEMKKEHMNKDGNNLNVDSEYGKKIWGPLTEPFVAPLDVVGYNYLNYHYESAIKDYPNRIICGTESKPLEIAEYWNDVERFSHVIGDFNWTSWDYIGEAGLGKAIYANKEEAEQLQKSIYISEYPWRLANCGDFDICGFERPQLAFRRIVWGSNETYIASHNPKNYDKIEILQRWAWPECQNSWNWKECEGQNVKVDVYSQAKEVELIINDKSYGRKPAGKENGYKAQFDVLYKAGTIKAISYTDDKEISFDEIKTSNKASKIRITPETLKLKADGNSLCYAPIEIIDSDGNIVSDAQILTKAKVEGQGSLVGFGSARPKTEENYTKGEFTSFHGRLLAVVRAGYEKGEIKLTVSAKDLTAASIVIEVI